MLVQIQQQSVLIGRKPNGFTQHYYTEWDDGLGREKISLFMVLSIGSTQVPGDEVGKEAFQLLQDHFLNDLEGDPYDRFEIALREINIMVAEQEKNLGLKFIPNVNVLVGVIQKDMLFLSKHGDLDGYLIRKRHVSSITDGLSDGKNTEDLFQNIASGILEVNDSVVLATGHLVQFVTPSDLAKIFSEQSLDDACKELKDLLKSDIEEQMCLLSFEVLEKTAEAIQAGEFEGDVISDDAYTLSDEEVEGGVVVRFGRAARIVKSVVPSEKLVKPIKILREWAARQQRLNFLSQIRTWGRDKILIGIIVGVVLFGGGVTYMKVVGGQQKQLKGMQAKLTAAEEDLVQAGTRGTFDKATAVTLLDDAEKLAVEVLNSGLLKGNASQLLDDIEEQRDFLDNVVRVDNELKEIVDFAPLLGDEEIVGVIPYKDRRLVFTPTTVYQVLIDKVEEPDVVDTKESIVSGDYFEDRQSALFLTRSGHVMEYKDGNTQFSDTSDVDFKGGVDVLTYGSRAYFLDSKNAQIWKYTRNSSAFGSANAYLSAEEKSVDLGKAVSIAIDGSIWVLMDDGSIVQLLSGENVAFKVKNAPLTPTDGAVKIVTDIEVPQVYLLDPSRKAIYVYNKSSSNTDLTYSSQYVLQNLNEDLVDMFVDKDKDVLVIVTNKGLYELKF